ncbi:hypothetical protein P12x_003730 [Tundrisphaera lichenicola]|uniref:hypothetical protein n=1 Tax=Tundrisphaera lichenicola TaxID=2029860 RepID=UPI003EB825EA
MNPSYCRLNVPLSDALKRFATWNHLAKVGPLIPATVSEAIRLACDDRGMWRGNAVLISEVAGWTLFEDLSGALGAIPANKWLVFAGMDEILYVGYNDAIPYAELVAIRDGRVIREFLDDPGSPEPHINTGAIESEYEPFECWSDVAGFVDADPLGFSEAGLLWVWDRPPAMLELPPDQTDKGR